MSIGPTFKCASSLFEQIPQLAASGNINVGIAKAEEPWLIYNFKGRISRIDGYRSHDFIWLVFPQTHAINPLLWPFDFKLCHQIEGILLENGARRCSWQDWEQTLNIPPPPASPRR